jgi:hypothetical protein
MPSTLTTHSNALNEAFLPQYQEAVYYNSDVLKYFGVPKPHPGGGRYVNWQVHSAAAGTSAIFTEASVMPSAAYETVVNAYVSPVYIWDTVQISGILKDALGSGGHYDAFDLEIQGKINSIRDLFETSFLGSTYGLEVAIDSSTNYGGITRSSATYWQSTETAVSAALSVANLRDLIESCKDNDKGGLKKPLWMVPWNQYSNIWSLTGSPGTKMFNPKDPLENLSNQTLDGAPVVAVGDMTDTVILALDMRPELWRYEEFRPLTITPHNKSGDSDVYLITAALSLACLNPKMHGKLTGVTA